MLLRIASCIAILTLSNAQNNMCLWGVDNTTITVAATNRNGLYRYAGGTGTSTYFRLDRTGADCQSDYLYMYSTTDSDSKWTVSETDPDQNGLVYGKCDVQTTTPDKCGNAVGATGTWIFDLCQQPRAKVYVGSCPTGPDDASSCESITVTTSGSGNGCDFGTFVQSGDNQYTKTSGSSEWVWWFNLPTFQWICTRTLSSGSDPTPGQTLPATPVGICQANLLWNSGASTSVISANAGRKLSKINGYEGPFDGSHGTDEDDSSALLNDNSWTFTCNSM